MSERHSDIMEIPTVLFIETKNEKMLNKSIGYISQCAIALLMLRSVWDTCYQLIKQCCPNYEGSSCDTPLCSGENSCQNGGTCISANNCTCLEGFEPPICEDKNECNTENGGCSHNCTNRHGAFECSCNDGYVINNDNKTCSSPKDNSKKYSMATNVGGLPQLDTKKSEKI
ncbi:EGFL8-like protein [Mya arenaria]|uniref:EGFL8-like protein n=1 Tax=Mya arenaria TaxID=6604 RepID=A0ABY7D8A4_MYAAR|nr:EGFL8-like protein [Mya arenaria]